MRHLLWLFLALTPSWAQEEPAYTFGTTVVDSSGLQGRVFYLKPGTQKLPNFGHMEPVGSVYTTALNVWPRRFTEGFPNITDRYEWFAIEYTGKLWIENPGLYRFSLLSDDGAKLKLDGKVVINNDGVHAAMAINGGATLTQGVHDIKIEYFQGPRFEVALVLAIAPPEERWRIFNMTDFKPPKDPDDWHKGKISGIQRQTMGGFGMLGR
jgi:hypothetical protein